MTDRAVAGRLPGMSTEPIHPAVRVGHVHLRVADLDRALGFYRDALGLGVTADGRPVGLPAAFLAAGDYHHHLGLNTFETAGAEPPPARRGANPVRPAGRGAPPRRSHGPVPRGLPVPRPAGARARREPAARARRR